MSTLWGGVVGGTNSAVSAAMRRKPRQTRKHHQRYQPLPLHDVQGVLLDKPLAPFLLAVASVGTGAVCGVASGFMVGGPIGSAAGGLFGAAIGAAVLHRASSAQQVWAGMCTSGHFSGDTGLGSGLATWLGLGLGLGLG